ncbi:MAG: tetratricopeptide repeat protein, partial [Rubripirellula sp.]
MLQGASAPVGWSQDEPSEASMAAYADAANFQTGGAIDLAIESWKKFLTKYPKHPMAADAAHFLGVGYMQKESPDYTAAANAFARALKNPKYDLREESLANYGWCVYVSAGEGEERDAPRLKLALDAFQLLQKESPQSRFLDRALFYSGEAAYGMGNAKLAVNYYDKLLSLPSAKDSPLRCDALYARGVAHEELKQFDEAFASFKQLLAGCERQELITDVHMRLGDLQIMQKRYDNAIESFQSALESSELAEDRSYALFRQAFAYVQSDQPAEAATKYEALIAEYPKSPFAGAAILASAQSTYRSGDIAEAAKRFKKVLRQNNPTAATEAAHWLARIEITQGRPEEAARLVREQLERGVEGDFSVDLRL